MYSRISWEATAGLVPMGAQHGRGRLIRPNRASSANMIRKRRPRLAAARPPPRSVRAAFPHTATNQLRELEAKVRRCQPAKASHQVIKPLSMYRTQIAAVPTPDSQV